MLGINGEQAPCQAGEAIAVFLGLPATAPKAAHRCVIRRVVESLQRRESGRVRASESATVEE